MAVSEAALQENYRRLSNDRLLRLAAQDAAKLRPEALLLLRAELAARGLATLADNAIAAQLRVVSEEEILAYCQVLRAQPCPVCQSVARPLNATRTSKVMSMLVLTIWDKKLTIACPPCLDKHNREGSLLSGLLGWWGVPWGVLRTAQALRANRGMAALNNLPYPNDLLKEFVVRNVGAIEAAGSSASLQALLSGPHPG